MKFWRNCAFIRGTKTGKTGSYKKSLAGYYAYLIKILYYIYAIITDETAILQ